MPDLKLKEGVDIRNKRIVLTGDASIDRKKIQRKIHNGGGLNRSDISGITDILIKGKIPKNLPKKQNGKTGKIIRAEKLIKDKKKPIKIMEIHEIFDEIEEEE